MLPGFADVEYPDWAALFQRLGRDARAAKWRGPLVIDELPYLTLAAPELESVLQRFVDHEGRQAGLKLVLAGSSQRMMQGLALAASAPLYGRAHVLFDLRPLPASELSNAFGKRAVVELLALHGAWGGIPRYWELAVDVGADVEDQIDKLVLDPMGPLHSEPDRLLLEELPPAVELRPLLDAIGQGAHRVSEIAGRIGAKATSLSKPLQRLQELGMIRREVPHGQAEQRSKRSLYRLDDPFLRLWFRVVAPHRARLASCKRPERVALLGRYWPTLVALAWEELCRASIPALDRRVSLARLGPWGPGQRWWHGNAPEWDLVSTSEDGARLLLGEVKWSPRAFDARTLDALARQVAGKLVPASAAHFDPAGVIRALFVPEVAKGAPRTPHGVHVVRGAHLLAGIE